jgi:hypothetical protein
MSKSSPGRRPQRLSRYLYPFLKSKTAIGVALGLAMILFSAVLGMGHHDIGRRVRYIPVTQNVASGRVVVKPLDRVEYRIVILPEMYNAQVLGSFTAYGGSANTILAALMPSSEYASWITGHDAKAFYSTGGQKSEDKFAVRLDPGVYSFAISNRLSKKTPKFVFLDVQLVYDRREAY